MTGGGYYVYNHLYNRYPQYLHTEFLLDGAKFSTKDRGNCGDGNNGWWTINENVDGGCFISLANLNARYSFSADEKDETIRIMYYGDTDREPNILVHQPSFTEMKVRRKEA